MASTAMVAFILEDAPDSSSIYLYGSWDNFSIGYPMTRDYKRGRGSWHGCHMFKNIICDGEFGHGVTPRDGALKMRGRYWYHYKGDGDVEFHNPSQPSTTACPLLPGQSVNIFDVPTVSPSDEYEDIYTVNPDDRRAKLTSLGFDEYCKWLFGDLRPERDRWLRSSWAKLQSAASVACRHGSKRQSICAMHHRSKDTEPEERPTTAIGGDDRFGECVELSGNPPLQAFASENEATSRLKEPPFDPSRGSSAPQHKHRDETSNPCDPVHAPSTPRNTPTGIMPVSSSVRQPAKHISNDSWASTNTYSTNKTVSSVGSPLFSSAGQSHASPASSYYPPSPRHKKDLPTYAFYSALSFEQGTELNAKHVGGGEEIQPCAPVKAPTNDRPPLAVASYTFDFETEERAYEDLGYLGAMIH